MRNTVTYEWDYETVDENGDVIDHHHQDTLAAFTESDITPSLVLIRDVGNENEGLVDRSWAYVKNDVLPEDFTDTIGNPIAHVPARFYAELSAYLKSLKR